MKLYTISIKLESNTGGCTPTIPNSGVQCQIYLGWSNCDQSGMEVEVNNMGGFPFPDTPTKYTINIHPTQPFTYISIVYYYNTGQAYPGCPAALIIDSFKLTSAAIPITVSTQVDNNSCTIDSNGRATVHAEGYAPFTYLWSNGQTDSTLQHVPAGTYEVTVKDNTGCQTYDTVTIGTQSEPGITISILGNTLTAPVEVSYQWYLNGFAITGANNQNYIPLQNGNYDAVIVDSIGCTSMPSNTIYIGNINGIQEVFNSTLYLLPQPCY